MPQFNAPLFGLNIDPSTDRLALAYRLAQLADESSYDFISIQDHPYNAGFLDTWTLQTALAMKTQRVKLLTNVTSLPLRPAPMLAKMAASLDALSGGRVEVGLGAGAYWDGIVAYGAPRRTPSEAVTALEEAVNVMRLFWQTETGQPVTYNGQFYAVNGAQAGPAPAHRINIWLGAIKPRMLRLTARLADGLLISSTYVPPEQVPFTQQTIDEAARKSGRDPLAIRRGYNLMGVIQRPGDRAMTARRPGLIIGPPSYWIDELTRYYRDLRLDTFIFWPLMGNEEEQGRVFVEEVAAVVRESAKG